MIAACTVPWAAAAPTAYLIADQRSGGTFNPATGAWAAVSGPLAAADLGRLMVGPGPALKFASLTTWPVAGSARIWADIGEAIPGDQVVAFRLALDPQGNPTGLASPGLPPTWMDVSPAGRVEFDDGSVMLPLPGVGVTPPTVPGAESPP